MSKYYISNRFLKTPAVFSDRPGVQTTWCWSPEPEPAADSQTTMANSRLDPPILTEQEELQRRANQVTDEVSAETNVLKSSFWASEVTKIELCHSPRGAKRPPQTTPDSPGCRGDSWSPRATSWRETAQTPWEVVLDKHSRGFRSVCHLIISVGGGARGAWGDIYTTNRLTEGEGRFSTEPVCVTSGTSMVSVCT